VLLAGSAIAVSGARGLQAIMAWMSRRGVKHCPAPLLVTSHGANIATSVPTCLTPTTAQIASTWSASRSAAACEPAGQLQPHWHVSPRDGV